MSIKKNKDAWYIDCYPSGRNGKRIRKKFNTKIEAQRFEKYVLNRAFENKEWNTSKKDNRKLSELIEYWYKSKGIHLKDGVRRKRCLLEIDGILNNPVAKELKPKDYLQYIAIKKEEKISGSTLNNHLAYIKAVYNYLYKIEVIDYDNPLKRIEKIKLDEKELAWLTIEQIEKLLSTINSFTSNPHILLLTKICLATGARWGEVEGLTTRQINENKITFLNTKSRKSRTVPIDNDLFIEINDHLDKWKSFSNSLSAFNRALKVSKISLPKGQAAHVLRHSFASHFIMNGGNILALKEILGHSTITMTMRYAHLAPDYLIDAISFNPMTAIQNKNNPVDKL